MRFWGAARCDSGGGVVRTLCTRRLTEARSGGVESGAGVTRPVASGAALHCAALVLAEATPDAGVLAGLERPLQALLHDGAATADGLGFLDLQQRRTGVADGEEQLGVFLTTNGVVTPVHGCYLSLVLHAGACECERFHESPRRRRSDAQMSWMWSCCSEEGFWLSVEADVAGRPDRQVEIRKPRLRIQPLLESFF